MRYIAIFLLLANIGYFSWVRYGAEPIVPPVPNIPRQLLNSGLTLVSEYEAQLAAQPALNCFAIGGFSTIDDASSLIAELGDAAFASDVSLSGDPLSSQYRVFIPPASSRRIATITLDGLSESLIAAELESEIYLITRGMLENGIALGVFSELANAEAARNGVQGLGYAPEIEEIPRSTGEIQVQLQVLERYVLENPAWLELTAGRPDLTITENLCETIAQGTQFP
ncbi:MAG: hypothetical protein COB20_00365 [SAR86 cluster bacterium]|uniref:SPOR domain-containing protein n=1 Tax=SAR86 cluster bacterium TaxID=2030880 RepID=A0A2A4XK00_9GAMM|nr:MAG: hypothetical protein COB20_00365 [SAR86 cluster bacterium]